MRYTDNNCNANSGDFLFDECGLVRVSIQNTYSIVVVKNKELSTSKGAYHTPQMLSI